MYYTSNAGSWEVSGHPCWFWPINWIIKNLCSFCLFIWQPWSCYILSQASLMILICLAMDIRWSVSLSCSSGYNNRETLQALPSTAHIVLSSIVACSKSLSRRIRLASVQFNSITQLCLTLCYPMNHSTPGLPACPLQTPGIYANSCPLNRWCHPTISSSVIPFSSCLQSFPVSGSFQMNQLFTSGSQSIGVSASTSVLPVNTQDWSPLGWTTWISLQSKGFSRVFSNTTVQKHQFFCTQLSL